jgi:NAD(P)H-dependent flavin oxidoreductase YrpB (nitropropane dioxygenase family)
MVLSTKLTQRLGIRHPIIQGGMHYVGYAPLAAAVSNAGAIGVVTALTQPDADSLRTEIQKTRSLLKDKDTPIGVSAFELLSNFLAPAACTLCASTKVW